MYNLENEELDNSKEKLVIFDDPMNSNDDMAQYLIIAELQKYWQNPRGCAQFIILTHNKHFYIQLRPTNPKYDKVNYYRLRKSKKTEIYKITKKNEDAETIYDELWGELKFAYSHNKNLFMWNNMRRILENYLRFMYCETEPIALEQLFNDKENKILAIALIKSLHVNSHIGYETDIEIIDKSCEELKNSFAQIFDKLGAPEHFTNHWDNDL